MSIQSSPSSNTRVNVTAKHNNPIFDPTATFTAKVQRDQTYRPYLENFPEAQLGFAGHFYSIQVARSFMNSNPPTSTSHEDILDGAVLTSLMCGLKDIPSLNQLILAINSQNSNIPDIVERKTNVEQIQSGYTILNHIIPTPTEDGYRRFAIIFQKNGGYIVVMGEYDEYEDGPLYYVRNCDSPTQYGFFEKSELITHLNETYSFSQIWEIDGTQLKEYSTISYCFLDRSFTFDPNILITQTTERVRQMSQNNLNHYESQATNTNATRVEGIWTNNSRNSPNAQQNKNRQLITKLNTELDSAYDLDLR